MSEFDSEAYRERASSTAGITVWTSLADGSPSWILPDGCIDVLWDGRHATVAGPDTVAQVACASAGTSFAAVRCAAGVGPAVLGIAADGLRDQRPRLEDVIGRDDADRLVEALLADADPSTRLERWAAERLAQAGGPDPAMRRVVTLIGDGLAVSAVAASVGYSERQLRRRALASFGYGPKMLARVLRMQRALGCARGGMPLTEVATAAGYADQAHLAHEMRSLAGRTLTQLVGNSA